jgi:Uma2 family endonuclease
MTTVSSSPLPPSPASDAALLEAIQHDVRFEVVDDQIRELPPMGAEEALLASTLFRLLSPVAWNAGVGQVVSEVLFLLTPQKNLQRRPDLAMVSFKRWPRDRRRPKTVSWEVVPNLVVEVVSPTNYANEVAERLEDYFRSGVERAWVVFPTVSKLYDYDSRNTVRILSRDQTLEGGALLPGFQLPLSELFEDEVPEPGELNP